jgi:hypothetical protein
LHVSSIFAKFDISHARWGYCLYDLDDADVSRAGTWKYRAPYEKNGAFKMAASTRLAESYTKEKLANCSLPRRTIDEETNLDSRHYLV